MAVGQYLMMKCMTSLPFLCFFISLLLDLASQVFVKLGDNLYEDNPKSGKAVPAIELYRRELEQPLLAATGEYYSRKSVTWREGNDVPQYMRLVCRVLRMADCFLFSIVSLDDSVATSQPFLYSRA